mmetsp:Transcript_96160/g.180961  ORF Transcript_96160/g.180961 Transcript_96160/m.180961 type:complete len:278 (-) Transcript_96160:114-947(-)
MFRQQVHLPLLELVLQERQVPKLHCRLQRWKLAQDVLYAISNLSLLLNQRICMSATLTDTSLCGSHLLRNLFLAFFMELGHFLCQLCFFLFHFCLTLLPHLVYLSHHVCLLLLKALALGLEFQHLPGHLSPISFNSPPTFCIELTLLLGHLSNVIRKPALEICFLLCHLCHQIFPLIAKMSVVTSQIRHFVDKTVALHLVLVHFIDQTFTLLVIFLPLAVHLILLFCQPLILSHEYLHFLNYELSLCLQLPYLSGHVSLLFEQSFAFRSHVGFSCRR